MYSLRVCGLYATALAALALERQWRVVQPPEELRALISPEDRFAPFDLDIQDRPDRQGVIAVGMFESVNAFQELLFEELLDVIACPAPTELGAIYLGIVQKKRAGGYDIDLGCGRGFLPQAGLTRPLKKGEAIRVQIKEISHHQPIVTAQLSLAGRFVVLSQENGVGVSKEITDPAERERLLTLGRRCCPNGWGVIWRTGAYGQDANELRAEVTRLQRELCTLDDHPHEGIPGQLRAGESTLIVEFPGGSKNVLDGWRARLVSTEPGYHQRHAAGSVGAWPAIGDPIVIEHVKAHSELNILLTGRVTDSTERSVTVRREIRGRGLYDGLQIPKEPGDYALSLLCAGAWRYETRYYTRDGQLKGIYININTPIEIYSDRVRYVDLELDVVQRPGERALVIDEPALHCLDSLVSPKLLAHARAVAAECVQRLNQGISGMAEK